MFVYICYRVTFDQVSAITKMNNICAMMCGIKNTAQNATVYIYFTKVRRGEILKCFRSGWVD